jgi:hypothetical protein
VEKVQDSGPAKKLQVGQLENNVSSNKPKKKNKVNRRKFGILMTWYFMVKDSKFKKVRWAWHVEGKKECIELTTYALMRIYFGFMCGLNGR